MAVQCFVIFQGPAINAGKGPLFSLAERVEITRLHAEGRADAEAVADNATPAGRARNRRVEVTLMVQDGR